jgi:transcriptional regulator with XRE-family HTH domain
MDDHPGETIKRLRLERKMRLEDLADKIGTDTGNLSRLENGKQGYDSKTLQRLAKAFGISIAELFERRGVRAGEPRLSDYIVLPHGGEPSADEFQLVINPSFRGSCGGGVINWEEVLKKPLAFQREWLKAKGLTPESALIMYADGRSMESFIMDGDVVMFNKARTQVRSGEVYAIEHPEGIRIKRVRLDYDGSLILASDNPDKSQYPDDRVSKSVAEDVRILGEFVWRGGG